MYFKGFISKSWSKRSAGCRRRFIQRFPRRMNMDLKAKIEEIVKKLTSDKNLLAKFEKNPIAVIESLVGIDLPDDQVDKLIEGIKAKISLDKVGSALGSLGSLFGK